MLQNNLIPAAPSDNNKLFTILFKYVKIIFKNEVIVNICLNNLKIFELNLKLKNKANNSDKKTMKKY